MKPHSLSRRTFGAALAASLGVLCGACAATSAAERPKFHLQYGADLPTGVMGQRQLQRGGPLAGYFQPVEVTAPEGAAISMAEAGGFGDPSEKPVLAGMLIGQVYHLKVTQIPLNEGKEVFPTIELLDRLYPPQGQELRFPIPIELTLEELDLAASGRYVTRVIYLEDPRNALAVRQDPKSQRYFEVDSNTDVLDEADRLGRPMAILRMGSREPTFEEYANGTVRMAPFMRYKRPETKPGQGILIPPQDKDRPAADFHPHVPRVEPGQKFTLLPTYLLPQQDPRAVPPHPAVRPTQYSAPPQPRRIVR